MNTQLSKLNSAPKKKTSLTLRIIKKHFENEKLSHELFVTTRQKTVIRSSFANSMSADIKFSKVQLSKTIQSGGFLRSMLGSLDSIGETLAKKVLTKLAAPFTKDFSQDQ